MPFFLSQKTKLTFIAKLVSFDVNTNYYEEPNFSFQKLKVSFLETMKLRLEFISDSLNKSIEDMFFSFMVNEIVTFVGKLISFALNKY